MSEKQIFVVGHRNPDTDSVASAIAYAELKRLRGDARVRAAAAGGLNPQTRYVLQRLSLPEPHRLSDVFPKVQDFLRGEPICATADMPLREALALFHRHAIRILPVVDGDRRPVGLVSLLKLSEQYLAAGAEGKREVTTSLRSLAQTLAADFICGKPSDELAIRYLFVGAMSERSFRERICGYPPDALLIVTGDRPEIQREALENGVGILVVTGGQPLDPQLRELAERRGCTVLTTPHDTATAAWMIRLSTPLRVFAESSFSKVELDDAVDAVRLKLLHAGEPAVLVIDDDGRLAGVVTKSSLLAPSPHALILVDHNELGQAVPGAEGVEILEVIDHHKLGNPPTSQPIAFNVAPVGSTCSLVASRYREYGIPPRFEIAALLMAGILSDTVILKSPTTTPFDRDQVSWLEGISGLDHQAFGQEIFTACSGFSAHGSTAEAIRADFKHFGLGGDFRFGIGQIEVVNFEEFHPLLPMLRPALEQVRREDRLGLAGLMVTNIQTETTLLLTTHLPGLDVVIDAPSIDAEIYELKGVMSRKKQMIPLLIKALQLLGKG